ncbi:helix-turn-helix domain-containing protein [Streptomyces sp. SID1046]|uniref:helix-turn-helix domain-containing protein n=1 Tax=Streptomyces sp. SID1046 TaxID=2690249 RepID=UPI00136FE1E1|nr:helix-turn-helix domain-containing protein [Streptomyces sp. SID1046]
MQPATPPWILEARTEIGRRVRKARLAAELTQDKLAELAEIDRRTLQRTEAGQFDLKVSQLFRLARALHLPARDLLPPNT